MGCTAACLPLWAAYSQNEHRKALILSAISAVPRGGGTDLNGAAEALNKLIA
jgi:hypothetical protein